MPFPTLPFTKEEILSRGLMRDGIGFPYNPLHIERSKELRKNMTNAEKKLRNGFLKTHSYKFYRQRPIDHFIVDFYCAKVALVIEIDGDSHFTDEGREYDKMRTEILGLYNLHILRFTNDDVYKNFEGVCQTIDKYIRNHV